MCTNNSIIVSIFIFPVLDETSDSLYLNGVLNKMLTKSSVTTLI